MLWGLELCSLMHFGRRVLRGDRRGFTMVGYEWSRDRSIPKLDLPDKTISAHADRWTWPIDDALRARDPLALLVGSTGINLSADEVTYPAASSYAEFFEFCIQRLAKIGVERTKAVSVLVAWALHMIQDLCVPHHAACMLLAGHAAFEADAHEAFIHMSPSLAACPELAAGESTPHGSLVTFREIAEECAGRSYAPAEVLAMEHEVHHPYWTRRVESCVALGFSASLLALRSAQDRYLHDRLRNP